MLVQVNLFIFKTVQVFNGVSHEKQGYLYSSFRGFNVTHSGVSIHPFRCCVCIQYGHITFPVAPHPSVMTVWLRPRFLFPSPRDTCSIHHGCRAVMTTQSFLLSKPALESARIDKRSALPLQTSQNESYQDISPLEPSLLPPQVTLAEDAKSQKRSDWAHQPAASPM